MTPDPLTSDALVSLGSGVYVRTTGEPSLLALLGNAGMGLLGLVVAIGVLAMIGVV